jgi:carbamate kinase
MHGAVNTLTSMATGRFVHEALSHRCEALIESIGSAGSLGLITDAPNLPRALRGETGTRVVPD